MGEVTPELLAELAAVVGHNEVITDDNVLRTASKDYYWFSPVLRPQLDGKQAAVLVRPGSQAELCGVIAAAARARVPITLRGAGTGNYGQGVPMQGGILLSTRRLARILHLDAKSPTPSVTVEAGTLLHTIEHAARGQGAELRFYPSTLQTATAGGFLAGGAGGVGSVTWGTLWDPGNVLGVTAVTVEEEPRLLHLHGDDALQGVIHNCGLTCVIADLTLALAEAQPYQQYVVAFAGFEAALGWGGELAANEALPKRLVSVLEWPIPSFFKTLGDRGICPPGAALVLLQVVAEPAAVAQRAEHAGGRITWHGPHATYLRGGIQLSDYAWNHTTLWAIKADPNLTYLQDQFDPERVLEQIAARRSRFGADLLHHIEFMRFRGRLYPQGMTLVRSRSREHLWAIMDECERLGIWNANPHTHYLDEDVRWNGRPILDARRAWDPHGLLNPGHLRALEAAAGVTAGHTAGHTSDLTTGPEIQP